MEGKTIHWLLEIDPATGKFTRNESNLLASGLLVVDETSMVDVLLIAFPASRCATTLWPGRGGRCESAASREPGNCPLEPDHENRWLFWLGHEPLDMPFAH
jgi:hypothetical protein